MNLASYIEASVREYADRIAVRMGDSELTYADLQRPSARYLPDVSCWRAAMHDLALLVFGRDHYLDPALVT